MDSLTQIVLGAACGFDRLSRTFVRLIHTFDKLSMTFDKLSMTSIS
jgi:hypothetical protein